MNQNFSHGESTSLNLEYQKDSEDLSVVSLEELGYVIKQKRKREGLTLKQVSDHIGVSTATLSRLEAQSNATRKGDTPNRKIVPDMRTLASISKWLKITIEPLMQLHDTVTNENESTPDAVEAFLRADKNLRPETAAALSRVFRTAYDQLSSLQQTKRSNKNE